MSSLILTSLLLALSSPVYGHGLVKSIEAGGKTYQGYSPDFQYQKHPPAVVGWTAPKTEDTGPILPEKYAHPDIICHRDAKPGLASAVVKAGETVTLHWTPWPTSHHGPVMDYLAPCGGNCSSVDKTKLKFFKIDGVGMTNTAGSSAGHPAQFADDNMIKNKNTWVVQIPPNIKAGNYVLRHETIALHEGNRVGGAQNYPQCINLEVTGGGSDEPAGILGTALYTPTDPGIHFDIYKKFTSTSAYPVPGPPLYAGCLDDGSQLNVLGGGKAPTTKQNSVTSSNNVPAPAAPEPAPVAAAPTPDVYAAPVSTTPEKKGKHCRRHARQF